MTPRRPWPQPWGHPDDAVPPGTYRHAGGGRYQVLGLAFLADGPGEGGSTVVYRPLYSVPGHPVAVRTLDGWQAPTSDGRQRFVAETSAERLAAVTLGPPEPGRIQLVEPDPAWPQRYAEHAARIRGALGERVLQLEHIGSTSVPGLVAKPLIDILLVVDDSADENAWLPDLLSAGYELQIREPEHDDHRCLRTSAREANLHVLPPWSGEVERYLLLRDRLRSVPEERVAYAAVKRELAREEWNAVNDYADAKSAVVEAIIARARAGSSTVPRSGGRC